MLFLASTCMLAQNLPVLSTTSLANPDEHFLHTYNGNYAKDTANERQQYVGLWEYNQNGILFQLKLDKQDQVINKIEVDGVVSHYNFTDEITVRYRLVKNGTELFNNLNDPLSSINTSTAFGVKEGNIPQLYGRLLDHTRNVVGSFNIVKLVSTPQKILFTMERFNYHIQNPPAYYNDGQPLFSIPQNGIEMVKVE